MGPIEILVLNTGGPPPGGALEASDEDWEAAFRSLVLTPLELSKACVPGMRERGWGRILNVSSTSVREPIAGLALSNSNRMAAVGLLNTLAAEVAADGITVNTVATGRFGTERLAQMYGTLDAAEERARSDVPAARLGRPDEYGDLVAFLCSERAAYLTGDRDPARRRAHPLELTSPAAAAGERETSIGARGHLRRHSAAGIDQHRGRRPGCREGVARLEGLVEQDLRRGGPSPRC